jgi:hypothetical protein
VSITGTRFTALAAFPPGAVVTVYDHGTTTPATLYATAAGTTSLTNPLPADAGGSVTFYAAAGTYDIGCALGDIDHRVPVTVAPNPSLSWPG